MKISERAGEGGDPGGRNTWKTKEVTNSKLRQRDLHIDSPKQPTQLRTQDTKKKDAYFASEGLFVVREEPAERGLQKKAARSLTPQTKMEITPGVSVCKTGTN